MFANEEGLKCRFNEDIPEIESFRKELAFSLTLDPEKQNSIAERWLLFIKPRIILFKFLSTLCSTFIAIYGLGSLIFTFSSKTLDVEEPTVIIASFFGVSLILLFLKWVAEKRAFWYEYLASHLEAIIKLSPVAQDSNK